MGDEALLDVSFTAARARLADLARGGLLLSAAEDAYGQGITGFVRVGPAGLSRLVQMQIRELAERDGRAGLAIRWEVTGLGGGLFPVLDADIMLAPAGPRSTLPPPAAAGLSRLLVARLVFLPPAVPLSMASCRRQVPALPRRLRCRRHLLTGCAAGHGAPGRGRALPVALGGLARHGRGWRLRPRSCCGRRSAGRRPRPPGPLDPPVPVRLSGLVTSSLRGSPPRGRRPARS